ncbi:hypothetical protein CANCADRAFT_4322 [Tortispora caseinolytica NRRL Y-17796]|uniref:Zn(2)-C6 fungal-type domain-containing protein n=1 Tax=Tortispora caseinolytica NRRL Y-17796 TaxID=767744 RepID=A0A1E4TDG7_9ASCO|nr:hypothetical protein CANCADRAFT_4322 [Tortispora caseinolytica NRRL Y-17796]
MSSQRTKPRKSSASTRRDAQERKRISLACVSCRSKKVRCDGRTPTCLNCEKAHEHCTYQPHNDKRKPYPKEYISALCARISALEALLQEAGIAAPPQSLAIPDYTTDLTWMTVTDSASGLTGDLTQVLAERIGELNIADDGHLRYFGATSIYHLDGVGINQQSFEDLDTLGTEALIAAGLNEPLDLDQRDHLLQLYWTWHNCFFNHINQHVFMKHMHLYQQGNINSAWAFSPLLLYSILALAALFDDDADPNYFLKRARVLLDVELNCPRMATVQAAAVIGTTETALGSDPRGWVHSGMAFRLVTDLGYHMNARKWLKSGILSAEEAFCRQTTFWGLYIQDGLWACYLGRPGSLNMRDISQQMPDPYSIPDTVWKPYTGRNDPLPEEWESIEMKDQLGTLTYYSILLAQHTHDVVEILYPGRDQPLSELINFASATRVKLAEWYTELPASLLCSTTSTRPILPHVILLHLQYWVTTILLNRPFLNQKQYTAVRDDSERLCRNAAVNISSLMAKYYRLYTLRRINIAVVHMTFTAATIHLLTVCTAKQSNLKAEARSGLLICCAALSLLSKTYSNARISLVLLTRLMTRWIGEVPDYMRQEAASYFNGAENATPPKLLDTFLDQGKAEFAPAQVPSPPKENLYNTNQCLEPGPSKISPAASTDQKDSARADTSNVDENLLNALFDSFPYPESPGNFTEHQVEENAWADFFTEHDSMVLQELF